MFNTPSEDKKPEPKPKREPEMSNEEYRSSMDEEKKRTLGGATNVRIKPIRENFFEQLNTDEETTDEEKRREAAMDPSNRVSQRHYKL